MKLKKPEYLPVEIMFTISGNVGLDERIIYDSCFVMTDYDTQLNYSQK